MLLQPASEPVKNVECDAHKIQSIKRDASSFVFEFGDGTCIHVPLNDTQYWATSARAECGLGNPPPAQTRASGAFFMDISKASEPKLYVNTGAWRQVKFCD